MPKHDNDDRRKGGDNERDDERMFKNLSEAVCALTCELFEHRKLWLSNLATKQDLRDAECRIIASVHSTGPVSEDDQKRLDSLSKRTERITRKLEALDARTNLPAQ